MGSWVYDRTEQDVKNETDKGFFDARGKDILQCGLRRTQFSQTAIDFLVDAGCHVLCG